MKTKIDLENWKRKEHYAFFKDFDEPFHGVSVRMNMTRFFQQAHQYAWHKSSRYFHKCMQAVNAIESFRLRMEGNQVYLYDRIDFGMTVLRDNRTYGYSYTEYSDDYNVFASRMKEAFNQVKKSDQLRGRSSVHMIHGSVLPWIDFNGLSHARHYRREDSCPKITFGKITQVHQEYFMPLSIHVHHCLVDGIDVGAFINRYQELLDEV